MTPFRAPDPGGYARNIRQGTGREPAPRTGHRAQAARAHSDTEGGIGGARPGGAARAARGSSRAGHGPTGAGEPGGRAQGERGAAGLRRGDMDGAPPGGAGGGGGGGGLPSLKSLGLLNLPRDADAHAREPWRPRTNSLPAPHMAWDAQPALPAQGDRGGYLPAAGQPPFLPLSAHAPILPHDPRIAQHPLPYPSPFPDPADTQPHYFAAPVWGTPASPPLPQAAPPPVHPAALIAPEVRRPRNPPPDAPPPPHLPRPFHSRPDSAPPIAPPHAARRAVSLRAPRRPDDPAFGPPSADRPRRSVASSPSSTPHRPRPDSPPDPAAAPAAGPDDDSGDSDSAPSPASAPRSPAHAGQAAPARAQRGRKGLPRSQWRFECPVEGCERRFPTPAHLQRHTRMHTGDKPFGCPFCGLWFSRKDNCVSHIKGHDRGAAEPRTRGS